MGQAKMDKDSAIEFSLLFAMLSGTGLKGDNERYRATVLKTFSEFLDGFGYTVVEKEPATDEATVGEQVTA